MQYVSKVSGVSSCVFLLDYRKAQLEEDYDRVGKLLSVRNVDRFSDKLDIRREIAFHRETGSSISEELALSLLEDLTKFSVLYEPTYIKNILFTIHKKVKIEELSIEVKPYAYLDIYFTFSGVVDYLYVNPDLIPKYISTMVLGDSIKQLEAQEVFEKLIKRMEEI